MRPAGLKEVEAAKADGRWNRAYDSPSKMTVPQDFLKELSKNKKAQMFFETLNKANTYSIAWRLQTAKKPETREKRMWAIIAMLAKGGKIPRLTVQGRGDLMSVARINEFQSKNRKVRKSPRLSKLDHTMIPSSDRCESCRLLQSQDDPTRFVLIEIWASVEAHKASAKNIPPDKVDQVMQLVAGPPGGAYYCTLSST